MKKIAMRIAAFLASLYLVTPVFGQEPWKIEVTRPTGMIPEFSPVIQGGLKIVLTVAALICFVYLIWGGIEWITSGGEKTAVTAAKQRLTAALLGLMVVLAAYAIILLISYLFGVEVFNVSFKPFFEEEVEPVPIIPRNIPED